MVKTKDNQKTVKEKRDITKKIPLDGVSASVDNGMVIIKGEKGENKRNFFNPKIMIQVKGEEIIISTKTISKNQKRIINTFTAHIKNMIKGVNEEFVYELKIVSKHFPMTVSIKNNVLEVKNFLGEKVPRTLNFKEGVTVKAQGDKITIQSPNKELAGTTASDIEQICRITNKDRRIFQDGIYITKK